MGWSERIDAALLICQALFALAGLLTLAGIVLGIRYESKLYLAVCWFGALASFTFMLVIFFALGYALSFV